MELKGALEADGPGVLSTKVSALVQRSQERTGSDLYLDVDPGPQDPVLWLQ